MPQSFAVPTVACLMQAAGALLTAAVLHGLQRDSVRPHLRLWMLSCLALAVHALYGMMALLLAVPFPAPLHPLRLAAALAAGVAGYLHAAWFLLGARRLSAGDTQTLRQERIIVLSVGAIGAVTVLLAMWNPGDFAERVALVPLVQAIVVGSALIVGGLAIRHGADGYKPPPGTRRAFGRMLVGIALVAYGLQKYHALFATVSVARGLVGADYVPYLGFIDFAIECAVAFGVVIWLLEDEQAAAIVAAERVEHMAYHDALTNLPNRQLFLDRLRQAMAHAGRAGHRLAVFYFDIDRFKLVNDSLGHRAGDELLRTVAARLQHLVRAEDTIARIGGDEFTLLSPRIDDVEDAVAIARKVRDAVRVPMTLEGREVVVTVSIGIATFPEDGDDAESLLKHADVALYRAKAAGRDRVELYAPAMNATALQQLVLEGALRRAVTNEEFVVHYQPIIELRSGRVTGFEALVRWQHPELGLLAPNDFIFLAEVTGLIVPIGAWVLRDACRHLRHWRDAGDGGSSRLRAAVNLSVRQLQEPGFVQYVARVLAEFELPPDALELEITESIAVHVSETTLQTLRDLKRLGTRIVMDDFGTGYSSLSALRLFPVDGLKIDRSFVHGVLPAARGDGATSEQTAIATAVIALAHSLNLTVVAEGVETEAQLDFLRESGCDSWQGYLCSRPVPAATYGSLLLMDGAAAAAAAAGAGVRVAAAIR